MPHTDCAQNVAVQNVETQNEPGQSELKLQNAPAREPAWQNFPQSESKLQNALVRGPAWQNFPQSELKLHIEPFRGPPRHTPARTSRLSSTLSSTPCICCEFAAARTGLGPGSVHAALNPARNIIRDTI